MDKYSDEHELEFKQSEERLLALMKATSDVIYRMSPDWDTMTELYVDGVLVDTDKQKSEWLNKYIHPDDQPFILDVIIDCIKNKKIFEIEHKGLRIDGSIGWTHSRAIPLFDEKGDIREWIGAASDITERKRAEEVLRHHAEVLEGKEKEYLEIINSSSEGSYIHDLIKGEIYFSSEWKRKLGIHHLSSAQAATVFLTLAHPDDLKGMRRAYDQACKRHLPRVSMEFRAKTNKGYIWILGQAKIIYGEGGKPVKYFGTHMDITERKQAEQALRESEEKYRQLFNSIDEGFCIIEVLFDDCNKPYDCRFIDVNKSFEKHTGLENAKGRRMRDMSPIHEQYWFDKYGRVALTGESIRFQNTAKALGRFYDAYAFRVGSPEQRLVAIIFSDITERKTAEDALKESQAQYRALFENAEYGCTVVEPVLDESGTLIDLFYLQLNPAFERETGLKIEDFIGKRLTEVLTDLEPHWLKIFDQALKSGKPLRSENCNYKTNHWYEMVIFPYNNGLLGVQFRDITERKRAEEALRESEVRKAFLLRLSDKMRLISDSLKIQSAVTHTAMEFFEADRCYYCEIDNDNVIIRQDASRGDLPSVQGVYSLNERPVHKAFIDAGRPIIVPDVRTAEFLDEEHKKLCIEFKSYSYLNIPVIKGEKPVGILCFVQSTPRNWTASEVNLAIEIAERTWAAVERTYAEEALRLSEQKALALVDKLEEEGRNKNRFISVLSHELRNPLAAIMAGLSLIDTSDSKEQIAIAKDIINRQTAQLCKLTDDLLELTRITQNKIVLKKENTNLNEVVCNAVTDIQPAFQQKGLQLYMNLPQMPALLNVDPIRIAQCLTNLLNNALKFTPKNGVVWISLLVEKKNVVISVKDDGIGIDPLALEKLFKPFVQADYSLNRNENGGLGLGLSIVKGMVELHGGTVAVYSDGVGKGAEFIFTLPCAEQSIKTPS